MEQLADKGNGNNYYIDSFEQAKRVFAEQLTSTLEVVAKDVKLQVDFDPALVSRYRLIGYENRDLADSDFRKDEVDAGQVGSGHQVTALYEVELAGCDAGAARDGADPPQGARRRHRGRDRVRDAGSAGGGLRAGVAGSASSRSRSPRSPTCCAARAHVVARGHPRSSRTRTRRNNDRKELVGLIDRAMGLRGKDATVAQ